MKSSILRCTLLVNSSVTAADTSWGYVSTGSVFEWPWGEQEEKTASAAASWASNCICKPSSCLPTKCGGLLLLDWRSSSSHQCNIKYGPPSWLLHCLHNVLSYAWLGLVSWTIQACAFSSIFCVWSVQYWYLNRCLPPLISFQIADKSVDFFKLVQQN